MKTILYHERPIDSNLDSRLVSRAGNSDLMPGDRVLVYESMLFKNDIDTPCDSLMRPGTVINRFGVLAYTYDSPEQTGSIYGPYPDYVEVELDDVRPTGDRKAGAFTYAVTKI